MSQPSKKQLLGWAFGLAIPSISLAGILFPDSFSLAGRKLIQFIVTIDLNTVLLTSILIVFIGLFIAERKRRLTHEYLNTLLASKREISRALAIASSKLRRFEAMYIDECREATSENDLKHIESKYKDDKQHLFCNFLRVVAENTRECVLIYFKGLGVKNGQCRVVIKTVKPPRTSGASSNATASISSILDIGYWRYANSIWDPTSWSAIQKEIEAEGRESLHLKKYKINEYPELEKLARRQNDYFWNNDLVAYRSDIDNKPYENPTNDWHSRYNAKAMVPIHENSNLENVRPGLYGFLSVDSPNERKVELFGNDSACSILNLMIEAADSLFVFFEHMEQTLSNIAHIQEDRIKCFNENYFKKDRRRVQRPAIH